MKLVLCKNSYFYIVHSSLFFTFVYHSSNTCRTKHEIFGILTPVASHREEFIYVEATIFITEGAAPPANSRYRHHRRTARHHVIKKSISPLDGPSTSCR